LNVNKYNLGVYEDEIEQIEQRILAKDEHGFSVNMSFA
jgi:hypothetical protein